MPPNFCVIFIPKLSFYFGVLLAVADIVSAKSDVALALAERLNIVAMETEKKNEMQAHRPVFFIQQYLDEILKRHN